MKLSLGRFNQLIADITAAKQLQRERQRERNEQKALKEEFKKEDIETLQRVLQPVLQETVASPIHKLQESLIKNLKQIEGRQKQLEAIEGREAPSEVLQAALTSASAIPPQKKPINLDPDKGLDFELLEHYKLLKPSEIFNEEEPRELVCAYIKTIDCNLKRWGGQIGNMQDKNSGEYKLLRRKIDAMRAYKDRIKDLLKALPLAGRGGGENAMPKGIPKGIPKGRKSIFSKNCRMQNLIEYKYYSSPDELINRLELLCAERDIGNDSIEVRNEIMSILDILLKNKIIDKVHHEEMFRKWS